MSLAPSSLHSLLVVKTQGNFIQAVSVARLSFGLMAFLAPAFFTRQVLQCVSRFRTTRRANASYAGSVRSPTRPEA